MTIPVTIALAFAAWTIATLLGSIGVYRWSRIFSGKAALTDFPADQPRGADWYRRAMRAHANCVENLPLYTAIVLAVFVTGAEARWLDGLAVAFMCGRIAQTLVHIVARETNVAVAIRFAFFLLQIVCLSAMMAVVLHHTI